MLLKIGGIEAVYGSTKEVFITYDSTKLNDLIIEHDHRYNKTHITTDSFNHENISVDTDSFYMKPVSSESSLEQEGENK